MPPKGWRTAAAMSALTFIVAFGGPATSSPATRTYISVSPPRDGADPSLGSRESNVRTDEQCVYEHTYLGNLPKEKEPGWNAEAQGLTHDATHWYFSQNTFLAGGLFGEPIPDLKVWRIPAARDLSRDVNCDSPGVSCQELRSTPVSAYNHLGDISWHDGFLFVPLTGPDPDWTTPPAIAVFRGDDTMAYVDHVALPQRVSFWIGVDPQGFIYRAFASCEPPAAIAVSPLALDFGDVGVGGTKTTPVWLTNRSPVDLVVTNVALQADTDPQFSLSGVPPVPLTLTPGATASIDVTYAPTVAGHAGGELDISGDVTDSTVTVVLGGNGISLADRAEGLVASLDEEVAGGELGGSGAGSSAIERLTAFRNMLVNAVALIEANRIDRACRQLRDALAHTDSLSPPQDFVVGPGAARIAGQIRSLMSNLGCE
jgi:hypothetical protein